MESLTPITKNARVNNSEPLPNAQTPTISKIWQDSCEVVRSGIRRGYRDPQVLASVTALYSQNHPRRRELPGDPVERFLRAHQAGFDAVQYVMAREVRA